MEARRRARRRWQWGLGSGAAVALAAGVCAVVWTGALQMAPPGREAGALALHRSTQALFAEQFAASGGQTSRIDRIVAARGADLRENEFVRWGVR